MNSVFLISVLGLVFLGLLFLLIKWMQRRKLSSMLNQYHQGLVLENEYQYAAALEIYRDIIVQNENSSLANDPLMRKIKERLKTLRLEMDFQHSQDKPDYFKS